MTHEHWYHAANPLTRNVPEYDTIDAFSEALRFDPLAGLNVRELSLMQRHELLVGEKMPLFPTTLSIQAAMTIYSMVKSSLRIRNPTLPRGRGQVNESIEAGRAGANFLNLPPAPGASLLVIKGITGTAKSVTVKHALRLLGSQVIHHGEEPGALWKAATQVVWLYVGMSHDGSRGGLLTSILLAVDAKLGTAYAANLPKTYKSIERLAGAVIALLHSLHLGVLVIDEIQLLNLVRSEHAPKMQLFLLNLINSGIPVVLIGNPFGFTWLEEFSQNLSRSVERAQISFHPCGAIGNKEDDEWHSVYLGIRAFYVLPEPPVDEAGCSVALKRRGGGIPRMSLALWCNAQIDALLDGRTFVTPQDIESAYKSEGFREARALCDGFANRDPILLFPWQGKDIPVDYYARIWGKQNSSSESRPSEDSKDNGQACNKSATTPPKSKSPMTEAAKMKAAETRERNKEALRRKVAQSLSDEDMRKEGLKQHSLASLDELLRKVEKGRAPEAEDLPVELPTN